MEMTPKELRANKLGKVVAANLKNHNFDAYYCSTKEEALEKAMSLIPKGDTIGWGGSATIRQIGLIDKVYEEKFQVIDRDKAKTPEEKHRLQRQALLSDTFLTSTNALSEDGQLVNIDGNGNRVAAMIYGPDNVIVVAGINKVCKTVEDAMVRARTIAAPINIQRFEGANTPCMKNGNCGNCFSKDCICAYVVTTRVSRPAKKIKVILVGEELGF